jgi:hypothetical protein
MTLHFSDYREDFGGVAFGFDVVPDVFELAVGADEIRAADDAERRTAKEFFHAARAESFDRFAEEIEVELLFGFEGGLGLDGVAAHAEDDHAQLVELLLCVAKLGRFGRSTGSVGFRIEKQKDAFADEIRERDVFARVVLQAKRRSFVPNLEHAFTFAVRVSVTKFCSPDCILFIDYEMAGLKTGHYKTGKRGRVRS